MQNNERSWDKRKLRRWDKVEKHKSNNFVHDDDDDDDDDDD